MSEYPEWRGTTEDKTVTETCDACGSWEIFIPAGTMDPFDLLAEAKDAHPASAGHLEAVANAPVHIRAFIRIKRGDGYYAPKYGSKENGSKTLCGAPAGGDIGWNDARSAKQLAFVTCDDCKRIRAGRRS